MWVYDELAKMIILEQDEYKCLMIYIEFFSIIQFLRKQQLENNEMYIYYQKQYSEMCVISTVLMDL